MVYRASVFASGEFLYLEKTTEGKPRARIGLGANRLTLPIYPKLFARLTENPLSGMCQFLIYPRTDREGVLCKGTWVGDVYPVQKREEMLTVLGELVRIDVGEGLIHVRLYPNPKVALRYPFSLPLNASLELIDSLPPLGHGVIIGGCLRLQSLRLIATSAHEVSLPPQREVNVVQPASEALIEPLTPRGLKPKLRGKKKLRHSS